MSQVLASCLGKWGSIIPLNMLIIRVFSVHLQNGLRVALLNSVIEDLLDHRKIITCKQQFDHSVQNGILFNNFLEQYFYNWSFPMGLEHLNNGNNSMNRSSINQLQVRRENNPSKRKMWKTDSIWKQLRLEGRLTGTHTLCSMKHISFFTKDKNVKRLRRTCAFCTRIIKILGRHPESCSNLKRG